MDVQNVCCIYFNWSANGDGSTLTTSKASSNLLNHDRCVCAGNSVIHPDKYIEQQHTTSSLLSTSYAARTARAGVKW